MASSKRPNGRRVLVYLAALAVLILADPASQTFWAGLAIAAAGEALRLWAAGHLEKNRTLTMSGPYAHVKNPLYLGSLILFCGILLAAHRPEPPGAYLLWIGLPLGLVAFFAFYFPRKLRIEEDRLRRRFGASFERYDAMVPALIPKLRVISIDRRRWAWRRVVQNSEHWTALAIVLVFAYLAVRL